MSAPAVDRVAALVKRVRDKRQARRLVGKYVEVTEHDLPIFADEFAQVELTFMGTPLQLEFSHYEGWMQDGNGDTVLTDCDALEHFYKAVLEGIR